VPAGLRTSPVSGGIADAGLGRSNGGRGVSVTRRVVLELEVEQDPDGLEPEEWSLKDLSAAIRAGLARPLRTVQGGRVVDPERDRLSMMLEATAEEVEEAAQLHWLATTSPSLVIAPALRAARPPLEVLVELDQLAALSRRLAGRLAREGL
jgi:hypothetical protein